LLVTLERLFAGKTKSRAPFLVMPQVWSMMRQIAKSER